MKNKNIRPGVATALSFSGGKGSTALLAMLLDGVLPRPENFIVCNADPGMENSETYAFVDSCEKECQEAGIPFLRVKRNLYQEILALKASGATRFDLPPFWTKNKITGKKGRLPQKCTGAYKIAPMDRAIRSWLNDNLGIPRYSKRLGEGTLVKWIGFSSDEFMRIKESKQKYVDLQYPMVSRGITNKDIVSYFLKTGRPLPPRSVCNGCFANDVEYFREMYQRSPQDWEQAVLVDREIRDLSCVSILDECYVSSTLLPLEEIAARNFNVVGEQESGFCHSGHCFV